MPSTFFGLEISRRALQTQQLAVDITGHNIANASTIGYSRQIANIQAADPWSMTENGHSISLGTGSVLDNIVRARDAFVDRQYRWETSQQNYWAGKQATLQNVEGLLDETSNNCLSSDLNNFWNAWSDLAKNPDNMGARAVVRERALTLSDSFHYIAQQVNDLQKDQDANVRVKIRQINDAARQIRELNIQINDAEIRGDSPNDLRDKRDSLVDDLAKLVGVRVNETRDPAFTDRQVNNYSIIIGNDSASPPQVLVDNCLVNLLQVPEAAGPDDKPFAAVCWAEGSKAGTALDLGGKMGSLQANIEMRDSYLPSFRGQFDSLAQGIAMAVNVLHKTGQGLAVSSGIDFFTLPDGSSPTGAASVTAATITLNSAIEENAGLIATGLNTDDSGSPLTEVVVGDSRVAQALSSLASGWSALQKQIQAHIFDPLGANDLNPVPAASYGDYYGAKVAQLGVDVQQANRMKEGQDALVNQISNQRESYSGVSLDEEMTNLVKFQKSYSAAARMVTMMDDMLDTIVNGMGITR
jgi:flagellar hook-associated protein 1 FlgK